MDDRISEAELEVMSVLWDDAPLTAAEVAERAPPARRWSGQTVKTLLARLVAKGALATEVDGRRYLYRPLVGREAVQSVETRKLVDRLFGGRAAPLVAQLAEQQALTPEDVAEIEALLKALKP